MKTKRIFTISEVLALAILAAAMSSSCFDYGYDTDSSQSNRNSVTSEPEFCEDGVFLERSEDFEKPSEFDGHRDLFARKDEWRGYDFDYGVQQGTAGRDYMHPMRSPSEFWIYEDEPVTMDFSTTIFGLEESRTFDLIVLVNFRPVPFAVEEAFESTPYPTFDDVKGSNEFKTEYTFELQNEETRIHTIFIPPESFEHFGTHDVRIITLEHLEPDEEESVIAEYVIGFDTTAIVHRGAMGCSTEELPEMVTSRDPLTENLYDVLTASRWTFLRPGSEFYDLPTATERRNSNTLATPFSVEADSIDLVASSINMPNTGNSAREDYAAVFVNRRFDEDQSGRIQLPHSRSTQDPYEDADTISFDVHLDLSDAPPGELQSVRVVRFPYPLNIKKCADPLECEARYSNEIFAIKDE